MYLLLTFTVPISMIYSDMPQGESVVGTLHPVLQQSRCLASLLPFWPIVIMVKTTSDNVGVACGLFN
jgi:hypothetical protein